MLSCVKDNSGDSTISNLLGWAPPSRLGLRKIAESWEEAMKELHTGSHKSLQTKGGRASPVFCFYLIQHCFLSFHLGAQSKDAQILHSRMQKHDGQLQCVFLGRQQVGAGAFHWHFPPNSANLLLKHLHLFSAKGPAELKGQEKRAPSTTWLAHHPWPKPTGRVLPNA